MEPTLKDKIQALINEHGLDAILSIVNDISSSNAAATDGGDPVPPNPTHPPL